MSNDFPKVSGLQLTKHDLHALGAVVAQWAIAERMITDHVYNLTLLTKNPKLHGKSLRREFSRLQPQWKDLIKDICSDSPEYLDVGLRLAGAAKTLKEDRDAATHWPASRHDFRVDAPAYFIQAKVEKGSVQKRTKTFTSEQLINLSERIFYLGSDVNFFNFALFYDVFPSLCTWHGPKPEGPILHTRPLPTIQKPVHPHPTSRA